jgi:hypothetical protein
VKSLCESISIEIISENELKEVIKNWNANGAIPLSLEKIIKVKLQNKLNLKVSFEILR